MSDECKAHSGLITRINGLYAILVILISLVGVQMIFQIPTLKQEILEKIASIEKQNVGVDKEVAYLKEKLNEHLERK